MEQGGYWMWEKRKNGLALSSSANTPTYDDSWEEQAFAEDAAGSLGGCVWPPRSYSCSFCRREFRSAQALGGHMNVHRRDRARLKQSPNIPQNEENLHHHDEVLLQTHQHHHHHHHETPPSIQDSYTSSLGYNNSNLFPPHVCGFSHKNPSNSEDLLSLLPPPSSPPRVITPSISENCSEVQNLLRIPVDYYSKSSRSNLAAEGRCLFWDQASITAPKGIDVSNTNKMSGIQNFGGTVDKEENLKTELVMCKAHPAHVESNTKEEEAIGCKRRRIDDSSRSLPFFLRTSSVNHRLHTPSEVLELTPNAIEDLDLELRLGERPKRIYCFCVRNECKNGSFRYI